MLIVANWKAYIEDSVKAKKLITTSKQLAKKTSHTIVIAPPAPFLSALAEKNTSRIAFAAQDVSLTTGGAQTGEVTAAACAAAGATYTLIGHSDRRARGDTYAIVAEKLVRALAQGLTPILCVGEQERDEDGRYLSIVREEITSAFSPLLPKERARIIVAYEPLWAIGKTAEFAIRTDDLSEMTLYIRKVLTELLPGKSASRATILYGGSVEATDIRALGKTGINGFLVGHASADAKAFSDLVSNAA